MRESKQQVKGGVILIAEVTTSVLYEEVTFDSYTQTTPWEVLKTDIYSCKNS